MKKKCTLYELEEVSLGESIEFSGMVMKVVETKLSIFACFKNHKNSIQALIEKKFLGPIKLKTLTFLTINCVVELDRSGNLRLRCVEEPIFLKEHLAGSDCQIDSRISRSDYNSIIFARSIFLESIRSQLRKYGFLEIETTILSPSKASGSANVFSTYSRSINQTLYMRGTHEPQLKRAIASGLDRVFEIGKAFRDNSPGLIEFTLAEGVCAWKDLNFICDLIEDVLKFSFKQMDSFLSISNRELVKDLVWDRVCSEKIIVDMIGMSFVEFMKLSESDIQILSNGFNFYIDDNCKNIHIKFLHSAYEYFSKKMPNPVFIIGYPLDYSPLAKIIDTGLLGIGHLFVSGRRVCEVVLEEDNYDVQKLNFLEQESKSNNSISSNSNVLNALKSGVPPMSGFAININKTIGVAYKKNRTDYVSMFPIKPSSIPR